MGKADMERHVKNKVWVAKDGSTAPISRMSDAHIENSIKCIESGWPIHEYANQYLPLLQTEITKRRVRELHRRKHDRGFYGARVFRG